MALKGKTARHRDYDLKIDAAEMGLPKNLILAKRAKWMVLLSEKQDVVLKSPLPATRIV